MIQAKVDFGIIALLIRENTGNTMMSYTTTGREKIQDGLRKIV
jgi:hypothetical protein